MPYQSSGKWLIAVAPPGIEHFKAQSGSRALINPGFRHNDEVCAELRIAGLIRQPHEPIRLPLTEFCLFRGRITQIGPYNF